MRLIKHNRVYLTLIAILSICLMFATPVSAKNSTWVLDETGHLTDETHERVTQYNEQYLTQYEIKPQIGVEVLNEIPSGYADIDEYRVERFNDLGVGNATHDSGVLLIIAIEDRAFAIETGYGSEAYITDNRSKAILNNMTESMKEYSITGDADHLNKAVLGAVSDIVGYFSVGVPATESTQNLGTSSDEGSNSGFFTFVALSAGLVYILLIKVRLNAELIKKQQGLINQTMDTMVDFYETGLPFESEFGVDDIRKNLESRRLSIKKQEFEFMQDDPLGAINSIRIKELDAILDRVDLTYPKSYYLAQDLIIKECIENNPTVTVRDIVSDLDGKFSQAVKQKKELKNKVNKELKQYLAIPKDIDLGAYKNLMAEMFDGVVDKLNLDEEGVKTLSIKDSTAEQRYKVYEEVYQTIYLVNFIHTNKYVVNKDFGHGTREGFIKYALSDTKIKGDLIKKINDEKLLAGSIVSLITTYTLIKLKEYQDRMRELREEEIERRRREQREASWSVSSSSSSSRSSSSSSSSYGSGFGGGSSGGGGASGGW